MVRGREVVREGRREREVMRDTFVCTMPGRCCRI